MRIEKFEDLDCWQQARVLVRLIYSGMGHCKDFGFKDQIQRAAVSVMSNIAEGFERGSNRDFINFLTISRASLSEVKSLNYVALDVGYFDPKNFQLVDSHCSRLTNLLNGFIRFLRTKQKPPIA
ncbi:four helix bundle protein [Geomesophilobacter sediminis]|uniref:Four helix bundle protein n=1 Tax=Geomesophilobacter sediminis TaxID=2798584 RepID=A0A8J7J4R1_9BACT|nr:four helix bundle protein [Geomesophilobacter sediminis]MBJ6725938.1 four helix bundle protein [Geomesophilobacter sediminis]